MSLLSKELMELNLKKETPSLKYKWGKDRYYRQITKEEYKWYNWKVNT
jgi:hypothetical protein